MLSFIAMVVAFLLVWWALSGLIVWFHDYRDKPFNWRALWDIRLYEDWLNRKEEK